MRRQRKPKGREFHNYRVVVEFAKRRSWTVTAKDAADAERRVMGLASRAEWGVVTDDSLELVDATSVEMTDGTWEFVNALDTEGGDMIQYARRPKLGRK